jgi:hypothetical protein
MAANPFQERPYCIYLQERAFTHADAVLRPCCKDSVTDFGNLRSQQFGEAWNGSQRVDFIRQFVSDAPPEPCTSCVNNQRHVRVGHLLERAFPEGVDAHFNTVAVSSHPHRSLWHRCAEKIGESFYVFRKTTPGVVSYIGRDDSAR